MAGKPKYPVVDGKKPCSKCKRLLPFDGKHFVTQKTRILAHCRECHREAKTKWSSTPHGKKVHREYHLKRYHEDPIYRANQDRYAKDWRVANLEKVRAYGRKSFKKNIAKYRPKNAANAALRRSRERGAPGHHTGLDIQNLYIEQDGCCHYCGRAFVDRVYHVDHMTPISRGGSNWPSNLALACPACNLSKHDMTDQEFLAYRLDRGRMAEALGQFLEDNGDLMARLAD